MSEVTVTIHNQNERLLRELREQSAVFVAQPSEQNGDHLLTLLRDDLVTYNQSVEREIYPLIDGVIRATNGRPTATMSIDHEFISEYVDWIGAALHSLQGATGSHRELLLSQIHRYLVQLEAVLNLHLEKEERVFLPIIAQHVSAIDQRHMLAAMNGGSPRNANHGSAGGDNGFAGGQPQRKTTPRTRTARKQDLDPKADGNPVAGGKHRSLRP
jgi:iron-sulfur cluster repair protein YtfE (RIC family)